MAGEKTQMAFIGWRVAHWVAMLARAGINADPVRAEIDECSPVQETNGGSEVQPS
jgi:hypothetical protein